jgi:histone deacetylase 1/2
MDNANTREYLDKIRNQVIENLKRTAFAPSVQMTDVPRNPILDGMDDEADDVLDDLDDDENKDKRFTQRRFDQYTEKAGELSDSEDEEENAANGVRRQPGAIRRRNQINYRNLEPDSGLDSGMATPQDASSAADGDMDSNLDAKMADAPRTEPEASTAAPEASLADETATDAERAAAGSEEPAASATSQLQSPPHDEDTTMEDAAAIVAEQQVPEQATAQDEIKEPVEDAPQIERSAVSPALVKSPLNETADASAKNVEPLTEVAAHAADTEVTNTKEEKPEHSEEPKKEE